MPLYDYHCSACGDFRAWRRMSEASEAVQCPTCDASSPRAMVAPSLALMNGHNRIAHQRNEKSAHEPQVMSTRDHDRPHAGHAHGHGPGHHQHGHGAGGRPWMIGH